MKGRCRSLPVCTLASLGAKGKDRSMESAIILAAIEASPLSLSDLLPLASQVVHTVHQELLTGSYRRLCFIAK